MPTDTPAFIAKHKPPPATVLDIGARDGWLTRALQDLGYQVTAIDPKPLDDDVIAEGIEDHKGQYDVVIARLLVHLINKPLPETLSMLYGHVSPHGILYFTNFDKEDD